MSDPRPWCPVWSPASADSGGTSYRCTDVADHGPIKLATGGFADHIHAPSGTTWNNQPPFPGCDAHPGDMLTRTCRCGHAAGMHTKQENDTYRCDVCDLPTGIGPRGHPTEEYYSGTELILARSAALATAERRTPKTRPDSELLATADRFTQWILTGETSDDE